MDENVSKNQSFDGIETGGVPCVKRTRPSCERAMDQDSVVETTLLWYSKLVAMSMMEKRCSIMVSDGTLLRLFLSQVFTIYFIVLLLPLKQPRRKNMVLVLAGAGIIIAINGWLIHVFGMTFYVRFYFVTLTLPYILLGLSFSLFKGAKFIFVVLTIQVISNVATLNGLLASYLWHKEDQPWVDTVTRVASYLVFYPILIRFIRPTFMKMAEVMERGWWMLNGALLVSYALAYFILFVPSPVFDRPGYFVHGYIGMVLSLLIYAIIFYLFREIQTKTDVERDKELLSTQVTSLVKETAAISTMAYNDSLTGLYNRYSLYQQMNQYMQRNHKFLVVFIDLNNLKYINDSYGHSVGDAYLKRFSNALQQSIPSQANAYRFAGDEFVCLIAGADADAVFAGERFKQSIAKQMIMDVPYYGISLGLSSYPEDGENADELIRCADQAMYVDKGDKRAVIDQR